MNYVEAIQEAVQLGKRIKPVDNQNYYYKYYNIKNDGKSFAKYLVKDNSFYGLVHLIESDLIDAEWEIT